MTMKKMTLTMVALLSMTAMQAQDNNESKQQPQEQAAKTLILPEGQRPKVMDLNGSPELRTERMKKELTLTDEQTAQVLKLNKEYQEVFTQDSRRGGNMRQQRQRADGETAATAPQRSQRPQLTDEQKAEMKAKMEKRKAYNEQLKTILTAEQYEKYQKSQMRQGGRRGQGGPRRQGGSRGPRPERQAQTPTE